MRLTLNKMVLDNFKGCKHMEIDFSDGRTEITGANATGKTTIVDAFCWVLWNKNANGDAPGSDNFREKPLDDNGNEVHYLETTVELNCKLDGSAFDLKRKQTENWVKKRGSVEAQFQGNVSTYWINGVETKKQDFDQRIKALADGETMRLIGSLSAFNHLEWKKRRQQLLDLADENVDGELLQRDEYRPIADEIAERNITPDELRKVLADQRKAINAELKMMPVRIDEAKKAIPEFKPNEVKDAEYMVNDLKKDIERVDEQIIEAKAQTGSNNQGQMLALEQEILSIKRRLMDEHDAQRRKLQAEADTAGKQFREAADLVAEAKKDLAFHEDRLNKAKAQRDALRERYMERKRKPIDVSDTCPTCGQPLPMEKVEATRAKAEQEKREALAQIQVDGKRASEDVVNNEIDIAKIRDVLAEREQRVEAAQTAREAANNALVNFPAQPDFNSESRLSEAQRQLEALKAEQTVAPDEKIRQLTERKAELQAIIDRNQAILLKRDTGLEAEQRIKTYEARMVELGAQLSETEIKIALAEKFMQDRCGALEASINSRFPTVRWKLFDTQINGGITEDCTCMIPCNNALVPYTSANTASQIAADVEIVDVLSKHYDIRVPLFVDGAESVNVLPKIDSQTITLAVSTDTELKVKEG